MSQIERRLRPSLAALALLAALLVPAAPSAAQPPTELTLGDLFDEARTGRAAGALRWRPDGSALTYAWDAGDGEALWSMDAATGETEVLLTAADLQAAAGTEDAPSLGAYQWAPDGSALLIESGGDLYLWRPEGGVSRLTETEEAEEAPAFSPDGGRIAYVREADLHLLDLADGSERALTTDGEPGEIFNGTTDWVYWEEIWGRDATAFWWGPRGERIAYYRFEDGPVGRYTLLPDPTPVYPEPTVQRYPKAGTDNPVVKVGVLDLTGGETVWLDAGVEPAREETYLARVHWVRRDDRDDRDGDRVALERLNREQTDLGLLLCEPATGACRTILEEHHDTWVNLGDETTFLDDGRFLWASERSGWRHLYLHGEDGSLVRPLTAGAWAVASIDHAGPDAAIVTAYGAGPLGAASRRVLRVPYDGSAPEELTTPTGAIGGWHSAAVSPAGTHWVHGWSDADHPGWQRLETLAGETVAELPSEPPAFDPSELPSWRIVTLPALEGETEAAPVRLPAALLLPPGVDASTAAQHPVIMYHYGCPASQVVADRWGRRGRGLWHKLMARRGYVVLLVDNRASLFFGKAGEDRAHRRFGPGNLAAQKAGVESLESLPFVDPDRIGLWGWSGGGSNTLAALL
ncbi:MAG: DPP IV N-terminal domain-containing protein, partial [Acidobacteriota bacterium]